MASFPAFLKSQILYTPKEPSTISYAGKTVVVTGANTGLGLEATRHFVLAVASTVIIACRTLSKGEAAKQDIERTENRTGVVQWCTSDVTIVRKGLVPVVAADLCMVGNNKSANINVDITLTVICAS